MDSLLSLESKVWLQKSIASELTASNFYKHNANNMQYLGYFGFQKFFLSESADELIHYQKIVDYINDMGGVAEMPSLKPQIVIIKTPGDALSLSYKTELDLMNQYAEFYKEVKESDPVTAQFILQFLEIQRKAVGEYGDLKAKYLIAEKTGEVLLFDQQIGL